MTKDDPFGLETDAGRTRIRPAKANRPAPAPTQAPVAQTATYADTSARMRATRASDNPLIAAFSLLLGLAPELESATMVEDPETLRARLLDNLTYARDQAVSSGVPLSRADQAAWFVAALLDDIALNTPWGGQSSWPRQPLVAALYGDVDAGERFFARTDELLRFPDSDRDMLELVFLCLSFGFRGMHRVTGSNGASALSSLRAQISRYVRDAEADDKPLSPNWKGVDAPPEKQAFAVPYWAIAIIAAVVMLAIYVGLSMRLTGQSERLYALANVLPPPERAAIFRPVRDTEPAPEIELETVSLDLLPLFADAAPPDDLPALTGREDVSLVVIAVQATEPEVFRSAQADINEEYRDLIASIARVIIENGDFIGGVSVVGHTDSIPVQRSNPFATNQGLSEARAQTIADLLIASGVAADLITASGKAATEPIGDNATREGRARNRRVEIIIAKRF
ncbi:type IVB secretion system protein IcmH/DotU [Cognatiyoonia sp. IB215182]|uniref:type IVB secretion system protein IcmH/DotU n=1 Tax=Cognatiyoonia sp. IB215182 TaxID=3097353 RepID=UPI002A177A59|nr:type IVB secretion system protein IcmH/DotU [Cognatiyoonia sp. IB215182]MDX8352698.1 type IVB secretion system protein IcmH/DotU [Cognatiyoonia sp. IB215182]